MQDAAAGFMDSPLFLYQEGFRPQEGPVGYKQEKHQSGSLTLPSSVGWQEFSCICPQALPKFLFHPSFTKTFPNLVIPQAEKYSSQQNGGTHNSASGHGINPSLPAGPVPRHSMHESNLGAVLFPVSPLVPRRSAAALPAPTDLKMRVP